MTVLPPHQPSSLDAHGPLLHAHEQRLLEWRRAYLRFECGLTWMTDEDAERGIGALLDAALALREMLRRRGVPRLSGSDVHADTLLLLAQKSACGVAALRADISSGRYVGPGWFAAAARLESAGALAIAMALAPDWDGTRQELVDAATLLA